MDEFKYGVGDIVTWVDTFYGKPLISDSLYKVRGVYKVAHSTGAYYCLDKVCGASDELSEGQTGWLYEEKNLFPSEREAALFCALTCGVFNHVIDGPCCSGPDARRYSTGDKVFIIDKVGNEWVASHVMCEVKLVGEGNRYTIAPSDSAFKECPEEQISLLKRVLSGLRYPESQVFKTFKEAAYACIALNQKPKENKDEQLADSDNKNRKPRFQKGDKVHALYFQGGKWSYSIQRFTVDGVEKKIKRPLFIQDYERRRETLAYGLLGSRPLFRRQRGLQRMRGKKFHIGSTRRNRNQRWQPSRGTITYF